MERGRWMNRFRLLAICLIFSGALNVGLIATMIFTSFENTSIATVPPLKAQSEKDGVANRRMLLAMAKFSFPELVAYLTNREPMENGYVKRDLALAALVAFHFFDVEKALSASIKHKQPFFLSSDQMVELYPGLTNEQYEAVIRFAYQEKWPLTSKGLFHLLKKWPKTTRDQSLEQSFITTPEFHVLQVLFQKTGAPQENAVLLDLVCEGTWESFEGFVREQSKGLDLSIEKRRSFLLDAVAERSSTAAFLLLKTDPAFARSRFDDAALLPVFALLQRRSVEAEKFCIDILHSSRGDSVRLAAAEKLYLFAGESASNPLDLQNAKMRFASFQAQAVDARKDVLIDHVVKEGETLWKIARMHKVKVDEVIRLNGLEKDRLLPGMVLRIPSS